MRRATTVVGNVLLGIAVLVTALMVLSIREFRPVSGADAMGLVIFPMILSVRWLAIAGALAIAVSRGAFAWVSPTRGVQAAALGVFHLAAGAASLASVLGATGAHSGALRPWAVVLSAVVPAIVIVLAVIGVNAGEHAAVPPLVGRVLAAVLLMAVAWGGFTMWRFERADRAVREASLAEAEAERARWLQTNRDKLRQMSPEAPLIEWLPWLDGSVEELVTPALAAIRARPALTRELDAMLRSEDAPRALQFMWLWMPDPPAELAPAVRDAVVALVPWALQSLEAPLRAAPGVDPGDEGDEYPPRRPVDLSSACQAAIVLADKYESTGLDFAGPVTALLRALETKALPEEQLGSDPTYQPRAYLRDWLARKAAASRGNGREQA
jgi:hypothetical protein